MASEWDHVLARGWKDCFHVFYLGTEGTFDIQELKKTEEPQSPFGT